MGVIISIPSPLLRDCSNTYLIEENKKIRQAGPCDHQRFQESAI